MHSPPANADFIEKTCALTALCSFGVALARAVGNAGVGAATLERLFAEAVNAECVSCGIKVSGADLITSSLASDTAMTAADEKLARLRLGYCARRSCTSSYYLVRLAPHPGVDWNETWTQAEISMAEEPEPDVDAPASPVASWRRGVSLAWLQYASKPVPICLASIFAIMLFVHGGCRIPGFSPPPRVFIVVDVVPGADLAHGHQRS